jgi:hypothetical protein
MTQYWERRQPAVPSQTPTTKNEERKNRKGIAVDGFLLFALLAVYFVISYEQ